MKQVIESNKPQQYFMELQKKKCDGKRLSQCDRVYLELYMNDSLPCYYFTLQMKPSVLQYNARIYTLREQGFIIKCEWHRSWKEKHSVYKLDKNHVEVEKRGWWKLW